MRSLKYIPKVRELVSKLGISISVNDHSRLYELLFNGLYEEPPVTLKDGYLIKDGFNSELDELKKIRAGGKDFISKMEEELKRESGISNLKVGYNKVFGYYIEISKSLNLWERKESDT